MLVTFTTNVYANITMFEDDALILLKMMGHSATVPGAILAADVPVALSQLITAIDAEKLTQSVEDNGDEDEDANEPVISMANRALPLINLMTAAAKANTNVMWKY